MEIKRESVGKKRAEIRVPETFTAQRRREREREREKEDVCL